ncbi:hypothetical protein POM88_025643 [Heracleum sosnowskyi]|uniref:Uncharacterized protein n=1 Tax=Heracleum sosnowskyi TaxID=360622 RepID=A0AAD8I5L9_9APIA|nr:hypothetical protein POM88_025643 [Heracleum sosnowskyi]
MLEECAGLQWFESRGTKKLSELGLPLMKANGVVKVLSLAKEKAPHVPVQGAGQNDERQSHIYRSTIEQQRALASGSGGKDNLKSTPANGKLQQWFREGLAGVIGKCLICMPHEPYAPCSKQI